MKEDKRIRMIRDRRQGKYAYCIYADPYKGRFGLN
jgi:hypothetical protein